MTFRRITLIAAAIAIVAIAIPAGASAAKLPVFHIYQKCSKKTVCQFSAVTNSGASQLVSLNVSPKCKKKSSYFSAYSQTQIKIKKKKFSGELAYNTYNAGDATTIQGKVKISGEVTKKDKIKLTYKVSGDLASGCSNIKKSTVTLKYKGAQSGG